MNIETAAITQTAFQAEHFFCGCTGPTRRTAGDRVEHLCHGVAGAEDRTPLKRVNGRDGKYNWFVAWE